MKWEQNHRPTGTYINNYNRNVNNYYKNVIKSVKMTLNSN